MSNGQPAGSARAKLQMFLSNPRKSRSREYMLTTRLVHDLTVAAAERGYDLLVYLPTVDSDGFDVILDDRDRLVPMQLKSIVQGGRARQWKIRRTLIRPQPEVAEIYGFEASPYGVGRGGGVILTTVSPAEAAKVDVRYAYTDIDVLSAIWLDILPRNAAQKRRLKTLRAELTSKPDGSVVLPSSCFLHLPSPEHLLSLCGLHSRLDQPWRLHLRKLLCQIYLKKESSVPEEVLRKNIRNHLEHLSEIVELDERRAQPVKAARSIS